MEPVEHTEGNRKICIDKHAMVVCTTSGFSMYPFLKHNRRDVVVIKPTAACPEKIRCSALNIDKRGRYVLHRLVKNPKANGRMYIRGDNCIRGELVEKDKLIGILTEFNTQGQGR